jgi:cell division protein FtsZ
MSINVNIPELRELKPRILVVGVGGAGGNAINGMIEAGLQGVEFVAVNTDAQDLKINKADAKIQLGSNLTKGLGAGAKTDIGQASADESLNEIINFIQGSNMVFITAGMGGGTGPGAAPIIAKVARELDILTVGIVTIPFSFEGRKKMHAADSGINELKQNCDTVLVISNDKLREIHGNLPIREAFSQADDVLSTAAKKPHE